MKDYFHRAFNLLSAAVGLVFLSPIFGILLVAIRLHDRGPALFRGKRVGRDGREFELLKFRSMTVGADKAGSGLTTSGDERVTPLGRFLRRTKLDELPQLWNVLLGQMNLVGPRPEDPQYVRLYSEEQKEILGFRPGMTSPASIQFRHEEQLLHGPESEQVYLSHVLPRKIEMDLEYCRRQSVIADIKLIFKTFAAVAKDKDGHPFTH